MPSHLELRPTCLVLSPPHIGGVKYGTFTIHHFWNMFLVLWFACKKNPKKTCDVLKTVQSLASPQKKANNDDDKNNHNQYY